MTAPTPATVAVPVELLQRAIADGGQTDILDEMRALLPKPPLPRIVAVDIAGFDDEGVFGVRYLKTQPDLLTLLDDAVKGWRLNRHYLRIGDVTDLKSRIRAALGVTE